METLIQKFENKLLAQNLIGPDTAVFGQCDGDMEWNRTDPVVAVLTPLFDILNVSALLFARPAEPYLSIIRHLAVGAKDTIYLKDNETRTFLHDIPVIKECTTTAVAGALKRRKCAVFQNGGIVTCGTVSPEQTFVNFSSVVFSCFVKFFSDYLTMAHGKMLAKEDRRVFDRVCSLLPAFPEIKETLIQGPFKDEPTVYHAIWEVGKPVVTYGLVDSVMGNVSCVFKEKVYISQTGSFLDALEGAVDACPMDNSACTGITASSELPTHMAVYRNADLGTIVHGHPKFSVILSMFCEKYAHCQMSHACGTRCPENRTIASVPVVCGETGTGPLSICHTVPRALIAEKGAVVYGHGVFTAGKEDFNAPFHRLWTIERMCRDMYFSRLGEFHAL